MGSQWITHAEAAHIIGCSVSAVERYASLGRIVRRWPPSRGVPTIDRKSAVEFREWWQQRQAGIEERRQRRVQRAAHLGPPPDGGVWLDTATAALVIGVSAQYVGRLAAEERIPATRRGDHWWFRRRDIEQYTAARAWTQRARAGRTAHCRRARSQAAA